MASGDSDSRERQENEIEAIKSIYNQDVTDLRKGSGFTKELPLFSIKIFPQRGSSYGVNSPDNYSGTTVRLVFLFPIGYPNVKGPANAVESYCKEYLTKLANIHVRTFESPYFLKIPEINIKDCKGLTGEEVEELKDKLVRVAKDSLGEVMVLNLVQYAETYLYAHQKRPTGSFYDEMLRRQKALEEQNAQSNQMKAEHEKKFKLALKEQIERKQETLREEVRRRKEQQLQLQAESSSLSMNISSAPSIRGPETAQDFVTAKKQAKLRRRNTAVVFKRVSEGSESSLSESSEAVTLEFHCLKGTRSFHRGELLGFSERGSKVFAGMDCKNGTLVGICEWEFHVRVDRKNRIIKDINAEGNTAEHMLKQMNLFETEFKMLQKLEHPNLCTYYGINTIHGDYGNILLYTSQEFLRGTTLSSYLQDNLTLDLGWIRNCANGILQGLEHLHSNNIVHRYLRDTSIFLDHCDNIMTVKITDYGLERKISEFYQSISENPEAVNDKFAPSIGRGAKKGDIYRFGVLILCLVKGQIISENPPDISKTLPAELQDFLRKCLTTNEHARWSSAQLLEHEFLKLPAPKGDHLRIAKTSMVESDDKVMKESNTDHETKSDVHGFMSHLVKGHSRLQTEFEILVWLGRGAFGDVLKVKNKLDGRVYALKRIRLNPKNKQLNKKITREVKLLSQLNHENVVRYFNSWMETVLDYENEGTTDETATTPTTDASNIHKIQRAHVHFDAQIVKDLRRNSLGLSDDIEAMAPSAKESDWSHSINVENEESEEDSEDEEDIFGPSFLYHADDDESDDIMFAANSSGNTGSKHLNQNSCESSEVSERLKEGSDSVAELPNDLMANEMQFMYIQMEFCEKSTLRTAIDCGLYLDLERTWRLFREIVEGLAHIHQQGMIHRDLKPVNIFLDFNDNVKIGDFGLATRNILHKTTGEDEERSGSARGDASSSDVQDESQSENVHTGQVGTHGYVAPELIQPGAKAMYNQKVDIYSLGIIFFEMFYRPVETTMERVRLIAGLRQLEVVFPSDFDEFLFPNQAFISRWLLKHDPSGRPTSAELLQSDYIPPPEMQETELQEMFRHTLSNSQSKAYKYLMSSCFKQKFSPADEITYDMDTSSFSAQSHLKLLPFVQKVKDVMSHTFQCHGGVEFQCALLLPKSIIYENVETSVHLMTNSGQIVTLPHDLRVPFARYVVSNTITNLKRYSIEKVFRERKVFGFHPRELYECAFDTISTSQGSLLADAETLSIVFEIIDELPWMKEKSCTIQLGHTNILKAILLHYSVDERIHTTVYNILADLRVEKYAKSQGHTRLISLCLPDQFITLLFNLMEMEGPLSKVSNILKGIIKKKGEAASLIKEALHELEVIFGHICTFGLKCNVVVTPTLVFGNNIYNGLIYQIICNLRRRKNRMVLDVIAAGGRYDELLQTFRKTMDIADFSSKDLKQYGVGISISLDKLVSGVDDIEHKGFKSNVDVVICSFGHHSLNREKIALMKEFWNSGLSCISLDGSETLETAEEECRNQNAPFLIILKDSELFGSLRLRCFEKERIQERKLPRAELLEFIRRSCRSTAETTNDLTHLTKVESSKAISASIDSNSSTSSAIPGGPIVNITFIVQDIKEKNSNWKRRQENQMMTNIAEILPKLSRQQLVELLGLELNSTMINTLASYFQISDKEQYNKKVADFLENQSRQRKYMKSICDGIFELLFEKHSTVIIIYGLIDNSYRVIF